MRLVLQNPHTVTRNEIEYTKETSILKYLSDYMFEAGNDHRRSE